MAKTPRIRLEPTRKERAARARALSDRVRVVADEIAKPRPPRPADLSNTRVVIAGVDVPRYDGCRPRSAADLERATRQFEAGLVATRDPADRAHNTRDGTRENRIVPAATTLGGRARPNLSLSARPRRYPPTHLNGAGLAIDSQFDDWHEARNRLAGIAFVGADLRERDHGHAAARYSAIARLGWSGFCEITRPRTTQTVDNPEAEAAGSALLRKAGYYRRENT